VRGWLGDGEGEDAKWHVSSMFGLEKTDQSYCELKIEARSTLTN